MSVPRYCVNLNEIEEFLKNLTGKPKQFICPFGYQRSQGFRIHKEMSLESEPVYIDIKIPYEEYVITGIDFSVVSMNDNFDDTNDRGMDYFHFIVNDTKIFDSIYLKDIYKYKNLRTPFKVTKKMIDDGLDMKICYVNNTRDVHIDKQGDEIEVFKSIDFWITFDFMAMPQLTRVEVYHIDKNENNIITPLTRYFSEGTHIILSEKIENYYIVGDYYEEINVVYDKENKEPIKVVFEYTKLRGDNL